ncbi:hypothetical protein HDU82_008621 [Entophlyctis luteolus]|nr:hypothetical protein HDU82_008621 [Entophlyctis luteolus]
MLLPCISQDEQDSDSALALQRTAVSLLHCFSNLLLSDEDAQKDRMVSESIQGILQTAPIISNLLAKTNNDELQKVIIDILGLFCHFSKDGLCRIIGRDVIFGILESFANSKSETAAFEFLSILTASIRKYALDLKVFDSMELSEVRERSLAILKDLCRRFKTANSSSAKFAYMNALSPLLIVCDEILAFDGMKNDEYWGDDVMQGLFVVLQTKPETKNLQTALVVASTTFRIIGPKWLFPLDRTIMIDNYKFAAFLIHQACVDLRVILDELDFSQQAEQLTKETLVLSHLSLLSNAIKSIVQTFSTDSSSAKESSTRDFPHSLLISVHHTLAEGFAAVLAHLVDRYERHIEKTQNGSVSGFIGAATDDPLQNRIAHACVAATAVWLDEDSAALTSDDVCAGMVALVAAARDVGFADLGGVFMNITADDEENVAVDESAAIDDQESFSGAAQEPHSAISSPRRGKAKSRFIECGGVGMLVDWVLFGDAERDREEIRVAVCCLLNLVATDGVRVFQHSTSGDHGVDSFEVASGILTKCLSLDLNGSSITLVIYNAEMSTGSEFLPLESVHSLNACCLGLFIVRGAGTEILGATLVDKVLISSVQVLYQADGLVSSNPAIWDEVFELWNLAMSGMDSYLIE